MSIIRNIFDSICALFQAEDNPDASWKSGFSHEDMVMRYANAINDQAIAVKSTASDREALEIMGQVQDMLKMATDAGIEPIELYEAVWMILESS